MNRLDPEIIKTNKEIERCYSKFNEHFFNNELEQPVFTIASMGKKNALGWCSNEKVWIDKSKGTTHSRYEINICGETLSLTLDDIAETILHEMVHLHNSQNDIQDTSRNGHYHNKKFKEAAESRGLIVEKDEKYGWSATSLSNEAKQILSELNLEFNIYRKGFPSGRNQQGKPEKPSRKIICPGCKTVLYTSKQYFNVICGDCGKEFIRASQIR